MFVKNLGIDFRRGFFFLALHFMHDFIQKLETQLRQPLPGKDAHFKMSHAVRRHYTKPPKNAKIACVFALFYPKSENWNLILIERESNNSNDKHKGQIGFPGGKLEAFDKSYLDGALRETNEEVGVIPEDINVLGQLTELYIPVSNFLVHPFVGYLDYIPKLVPQESEVRSILEVPFSHFQKPEILQKTDIKIQNNLVLKQVPYYKVHDRIVWGATAMMLSELLEVYNSPYQIKEPF